MQAVYTVPEYAARLSISPHQVRGYIERGELEAIDTSERGPRGQRPRWKITAEAVERFEARRSSLVRRAASKHQAPQRLGNVTKFV